MVSFWEAVFRGRRQLSYVGAGLDVGPPRSGIPCGRQQLSTEAIAIHQLGLRVQTVAAFTDFPGGAVMGNRFTHLSAVGRC